MFRYPRIWPAILTIAAILLCAGAYAQGPTDPFAQAGPTQKTAAPPAANEAQKHFTSGVQLMQKQKFDAAIKEFQAAKKLMPNQPAVLMNLGICYMQKKNLSAAEGAFREASKIDPKHALPALTQVLMIEGKNAEALATAKKLVGIAPKDYAAQATLGSIYLNTKNFSGAATAFRAALAIKPKDKPSLYNLGVALANAKKYAEARQALDRSLKVSWDAQTEGLAGYVCEQMGDKPAAIAHYDKVAWKHVPTSDAAVMSMVRIYDSLGKPDKSISVLKLAAAAAKGNYDMNTTLGRRLSSKGKYKEAQPYLLAARKVRSDAFANLNLAINCLGMNDPKKMKEADTYSQAALKLDPKNIQGLDVRAYILQQQGKPDAAIAQYRKMEQFYPKEPTANLRIASAYVMQNQNEKAYAEYQKAMKKAPDDQSIMISAAACLKQMNKLDDAVALLQKAIAKNPKGEPAHGALAEVYESQNKYELAIGQYKKILETNAKSSEALRRMAFAYDATKDYKSEIETYRKLIQLNPKDTQTPVTIVRVYQKAGQLDEGIAEIKKFMDANKDDVSGRALYGDLLVEKKDWDGAVAQYGEFVKSDKAPLKSYGYYLTGVARDKQGKPDEAIAAYKSSLEATPGNQQAYEGLKKVYDDQKKPEEFQSYIKTAVEAGTDKAPYDYFWSTFKDAKKTDEALKILEQLGQRKADSTPIQAALAQAYADTGAKDKAVERYKAAAKNKDGGWVNGPLGDLYASMDKNDEAVACYTAYLKEAMFDAKRQSALGDVYVKQGKTKEALATYKQALQFQPGNEELKGKITFLETGKPAPVLTPAPVLPGPAVGPTPTPAPAPGPAPAPTPGATTAPTPEPTPAPGPSPTPTPAPK